MPTTMTLPLTHRLYTNLEKNPFVYALLIILCGTLLRLWFISSGQLNLSPDEAQYWDWSRTLQLSYYSKGPLIAWNIGFWTWLFGATEFSVRFGAVFNSVISQVLIYWGIAKLFHRPTLAVLSLLVANTMPLFLASAVLMTTDSPLLICWVGAFFALYQASKSPHSISALVVLFICMALGNLAKYMMFAFFAIAIPYLYMLYRHKLMTKKLACRILLVMLAGCFVGILPIIIWNAMNGWVGFLHVTTLAGVTGKRASSIFFLKAFPEFIAGQAGVITPWWLMLAIITSLRYLKAAWTGKTAIDTPLREVRPDDRLRQTALLSSSFIFLWFPFLLWSLHTRIYANWPAMSFVGGIILAAAGLERLLVGFGKLRWQKLAPLWIILGAFIAVFIYMQHLNPLPKEYDPTARLRGWGDLGQEIQEIANTFPDPNKVFYFASGYDTTAALSFYIPSQPRTYCANFGRRLSQYDLWETPVTSTVNKIGWDAIYVSTATKTPIDVILEPLRPLFETVEIMSYASKHKGKSGRDFYIVKLTNYNGQWPKQEEKSY